MFFLRPLLDTDFPDFSAMNADDEVMRFFPAPLSTEESVHFFQRILDHHSAFGFGYWAVEVEGRFAGITGLSHSVGLGLLGPHVEMGWRLLTWAHGRGIATQAAREALQRGRIEHRLTEVFAYTTSTNVQSEAVMKRLEMERRSDLDFDHPKTPGWWGQRHIVYRIQLQ